MSAGDQRGWRKLPLIPALALVGIVALAGIASDGLLVPRSNGAQISPGLVFTSGPCGGTNYCISSPSPGPVVYPGGAPSSLPLTFANPLNVPLSVSSLTVNLTNSFPAGCDPTRLQIDGNSFSAGSNPSWTETFASGSYFHIPAASSAGSGTAVFPATLSIADTHTNEDACQKLNLAMSYSSSAFYTAATNTTITVSPSPSTVGQPVTLTATVLSTTAAGQTPAGTVSFFECGSSAGNCTTPIGSVATNSSGVASTSATFNAQGTNYVEAVYSPTDGTSFTSSTSSVAADAVGYSSCITASSGGNLNIGSGQTVCVTTTGKVGGNVAVQGGGRLDVLGGGVGGNITISPGGALNVAGGNLGGNIVSTGASYFSVCSMTEGGTVSATNSSSLVQLGDSDSASCKGNSIGGTVTVSGNTGGVDIGGNTINGAVAVDNNTAGTTEIEANHLGKTLACSGNNPTPTYDAQPNTVSGGGSGQCAGVGF